MDILHKQFMDSLNERLKENPEVADEIDISELISEVTPDAVRLIKASLLESSAEMLKERRGLSEGFVKRNSERWAKGFDTLEILIVTCTEAGEDVNYSYRNEAAEEQNLVFDLVVRLHARACQISQEILSLMKSGFADAAHARWRALHEVSVTAMFIAKHGQECAERFYFHDVVDSYDGMREHKKYESRLNEKAPEQQDIDECKIEYDNLVKEYGKKFSGHYGWAAYLFPEHNRVGFGAIEKDVKLDHMRPYYKWASQNIHSGSKGTRNRLGLNEATEDILLVGQSNSGMTDPAHSTAISLSQITCTILMLHPTIDHIVLMNIIREFQDQVGEDFLAVAKMNS
ncbi:DUF5677 domain-containing protein [Colwellia sp. Bg11-28]|uniref:DUF5677 domain-containing protein n=1 Tax=Colwellia sp. Bg11-28 TaxID=2058305 RepID=UPI0018E3BEB4|nr:DUF5677 domain-containing protein [Colwellia sp. Bg11-28]